MSLTVEITKDLEPRLMTEARKAGVDPVTYTQNLLRRALPGGVSAAPSVPAEEAGLLQQINEGFSADEMTRFEQLVRQRQGQTISPEELRELENITGRLEELQVRRMRALAALAELRRVSISELMERMEIYPLDVL